MPKSPDAFRTITEVADWLETPAHVLRFWESKFTQVKPVKRAGGRRYYRPADMELLGGIKKLLHDDGMTIKGVQKVLREQGVKHVSALSDPVDEDEGAEMIEDAPFTEVEDMTGEVVAFRAETDAGSTDEPSTPMVADPVSEVEEAPEPEGVASADSLDSPAVEDDTPPPSPAQEPAQPAFEAQPETVEMIDDTGFEAPITPPADGDSVAHQAAEAQDPRVSEEAGVDPAALPEGDSAPADVTASESPEASDLPEASEPEAEPVSEPGDFFAEAPAPSEPEPARPDAAPRGLLDRIARLNGLSTAQRDALAEHLPALRALAERGVEARTN